jgi:hypothetical protein
MPVLANLEIATLERAAHADVIRCDTAPFRKGFPRLFNVSEVALATTQPKQRFHVRRLPK